MNFLQRIVGRVAVKAAGYAGFNLTDHEMVAKLTTYTDGGRAVTGKSVNDNTAVKVTAFFACLRLLAETYGALPKGIFEKQKGGNLERVDHDLSVVLIDQPNQDMNGVEYHEMSTTNLAARGNTYSVMDFRKDGSVLSLYPVASSRVQVRRNEKSNWLTEYGIMERGKREWYPKSKIWHRHGFSYDGLVGLSPIECAREALGLALAGEEFNARLFANGLMPSAKISIPQWLDPEQREIAFKRINEMYAGLQNSGKPLLLEGGMTVESGLLTPDEAQFLQLRQLTVIEICRMMGVKPHMIAALERATDNNIERLSQEFVTYTLLPYIKRDEAAARQLFKPEDRNRFQYRVNVEGLLRADSAARAMLYAILLNAGVYSRNEVRALEGRNRVEEPEMNAFTIQLNNTLIGMLEEIQRSQMARDSGK